MIAVSNLSYKNKKTDIAFFIYFTIMALFFTKTYIQLAAQLGIVAYVCYDVFITRDIRSKKEGYKNVKFLLLWFGLFVIFAALSAKWAYSTMADSNTVLTLFRILVIGISLFLYVSDYDKAVSVIKAFIYSNVIMALTVLLTTPLSQYGKAGEEGFGNIIGQQRNTFGAVMTFLVLICVIFYRYEYLRYGRQMAAFFVIALLCSGSRGAMLQLVIIACLYVITQPGMVKKIKNVTIALLVAICVIFLLQNVPYLYETVWVRFANMISTVTGTEEIADSSAYGRELYKVLAYDMFQDRPLLGHGVDGFYCMLRDIKFVEGCYLPPRYSHCNYAEIAADFGLIGLLLWYIPIVFIWWKSYKMRKISPQINMVFIVLTSMIVLDYARIPWSNHIGMYTYFCIILLYLTLTKKLNSKKVYQSEFGTLYNTEDRYESLYYNRL
ncbi:MAG: O-antigen ligase family protein [Clostridia bacterium]